MTAERAKQIENELCRAMEESISDPDSSEEENEKYLNAAMAAQKLRTYWKERRNYMNSDEIFDMERELSKGFAKALEEERAFTEEESLYFHAVCAMQRLRHFIQEKEENKYTTTNAKNAGHI